MAGITSLELRDKRVLVLGLGDTGLSMARWCDRRGARVRVADTREAPPRAARLRQMLPGADLHCGPFGDPSFEGIDLIAISPGIPLAEPAVARAVARGMPVAGDMELFARSLPAQKRPRVVAITGTNGKTTVTSMAGAVCRAAGLDAEVAGNISPAVLDALMAREDAGSVPEAWVLELSSFQLETTDSLRPDSATVLNVTEDHLDRYAGMDAYAAAKARVFAGAGAQVLNRHDPRTLAMARPGCRHLTFGLDAPRGGDDFGIAMRGGSEWLARGDEMLMPAADLRVAGRHNVANALATLALAEGAGIAARPAVEALRAFRGLPHRVERVAEVGGVVFYDDSKGTNVGATVAALSGMVRPVALIAGGDGKGQDFAPLAPAVAARARAVVLLGRDAPAIEAALAGCDVPLERVADMDAAVTRAFAHARPGDAVLLSPACSSLDMYRNYAHRAEVFVAAVKRLPRGGH